MYIQPSINLKLTERLRWGQYLSKFLGGLKHQSDGDKNGPILLHLPFPLLPWCQYFQPPPPCLATDCYTIEICDTGSSLPTHCHVPKWAKIKCWWFRPFLCNERSSEAILSCSHVINILMNRGSLVTLHNSSFLNPMLVIYSNIITSRGIFMFSSNWNKTATAPLSWHIN